MAVPLILEINRQTIDKSEMEEYFLEELENEILSETVDAIEDWFRSIEYERNCA